MNNWSKFLVFLFLPFFAMACSEKEVLEDTVNAQGQDVPSEPVKLIVETDSVLDLIFEEQSSLLIRVLYESNNTPAADRPVRFSLVGDSQDSSLLFPEGTTGADGRLANPLKAGMMRAAFKVRVETTQNTGEPIFELIDVVVDGVYKGDLKVSFDYDDVLALTSITTNIHEGSFNCDNINFSNPPPVVQSEEAANAAASVLFTRLPENEVYTVTAAAVGPAGNVVAHGCEIADPIVGRGVVNVLVALELNPVEFEGVFDFSTKLHLNEALPSPAGDILNLVEDILVNPEDVMAQEMMRALAIAVLGGDASVLTEDEITQQQNVLTGILTSAWAFYASTALAGEEVDLSLAGAFEHLIFDRLPGWANEGLNIGGDVVGVLNHLSVGGKLEILSSDEEGQLTGEWGWDDFMFRWAFGQGCDPSNACCGRLVFTGAEVGLEPVASEFSGNVVRQVVAEGEPAATTLNFDLSIDEHRLSLQYGNIILFVLNQFVLPAATGQDSLACAIESLMGCEAGGEFVCGGPSIGVCGCERAGVWLSDLVSDFTTIVTPQLAAAGCQMAVSAASGAIENQLNELGFAGTDDGGLSMEVNGSFNDLDQDLQADFIDAQTNGILYLGDVGQTSFTGDMLAHIERLACLENNACASGSTCGLAQDVLNECTANQVCMPTVGERLGGVRCTSDSQCESGVCMNNNTCFQACAEDSDCSGDLLCRADGFEIDLTDDVTLTVTACGQPQ